MLIRPAMMNGPSPHARGTHLKRFPVQGGWRAIPACAGNTRADGLNAPIQAGHPRMRGEHGGDGLQQDQDGRAIPACAGNTGTPFLRAHAPAGHPRMRGEHPVVQFDANGGVGPSPHARGTRCPAHCCRPISRAIPACAGNTRTTTATNTATAGHPRMRGEHKSPRPMSRPSTGPSPHARGTRRRTRPPRRCRRAIPACAGNTRIAAALATVSTGHPRMRGEHPALAVCAVLDSGPSPHARGTHQLHRAVRGRIRAIPACAGNTRRRPSDSPPRPGHPRMRGEHALGNPGAARNVGPSPHARGTHPPATVQRSR